MRRRGARRRSIAAEARETEDRIRKLMRTGRPSARDVTDVVEQSSSLGERLADRVAAVGGSWGFIIVFSVVLLGWMLLNSDVLEYWGLAFDPYPYIFLNLMLSTVSAIQAPVIMMSQNRQSEKDRLAAKLDYEVNLRCELEMARLHEKLDLAVARRLDEMVAMLHAQSGAARH